MNPIRSRIACSAATTSSKCCRAALPPIRLALTLASASRTASWAASSSIRSSGLIDGGAAEVSSRSSWMRAPSMRRMRSAGSRPCSRRTSSRSARACSTPTSAVARARTATGSSPSPAAPATRSARCRASRTGWRSTASIWARSAWRRSRAASRSANDSVMTGAAPGPVALSAARRSWAAACSNAVVAKGSRSARASSMASTAWRRASSNSMRDRFSAATPWARMSWLRRRPSTWSSAADGVTAPAVRSAVSPSAGRSPGPTTTSTSCCRPRRRRLSRWRSRTMPWASTRPSQPGSVPAGRARSVATIWARRSSSRPPTTVTRG